MKITALIGHSHETNQSNDISKRSCTKFQGVLSEVAFDHFALLADALFHNNNKKNCLLNRFITLGVLAGNLSVCINKQKFN